MQERVMRSLAAGVGIGSVAFGAAPLLAPRWFGRLFGLPVPDPATASMVRSLGLRDAVLGMGLWSAATHGGRFAPWLLARALCDGGDTLAVGAGARQRRFVGLGAVALGAALCDAALFWAARRQAGR